MTSKVNGGRTLTRFTTSADSMRMPHLPALSVECSKTNGRYLILAAKRRNRNGRTEPRLIRQDVPWNEGYCGGEGMWAFVNCQERSNPMTRPVLHGFISTCTQTPKPPPPPTYHVVEAFLPKRLARQHVELQARRTLRENRAVDSNLQCGEGEDEVRRADAVETRKTRAYMALQDARVCLTLLGCGAAEVHGPGGVASAVLVLSAGVTE